MPGEPLREDPIYDAALAAGMPGAGLPFDKDSFYEQAMNGLIPEARAGRPTLEDRWPCVPDERHTFPPNADHCFCRALRRPPVDVAETTLFTPDWDSRP